MNISRNQDIDLIKVIAMFGVIGLHSWGAFMEWHYVNVLYESCVIAIPLFFMSSGYILLSRDDVNYNYVLNKIKRIVRFLLLYSISYWLVYSFMNFSFSYKELLHLIVGMITQKSALYFCWYLVTMIILYAFLPFFIKCFHSKSNILFFCILFLFVVNNSLWVANLFCEKPIELYFAQFLRLWNWLFYFLIGGLLSTNKIVIKFSQKCYLVLIIIFSILNVLFQEFLKPYMKSPFCELFYCSFVVELLSIFVFLYVLSIHIKQSILLEILSKLFLPVYIFHPLFLGFSSRVCFHFFPVELALYIRFFLTSCVTICFSYFFMKIPYMSKVFRI